MKNRHVEDAASDDDSSRISSAVAGVARMGALLREFNDIVAGLKLTTK